MAGARFDADQVRLAANLGVLELRGIFEVVPRHDAIVGVGGRHQHCGIGRPSLTLAIGRVGEQVPEIAFLRRIAIIIDPVAPRGEAVETQHVHHAHRGQRRGEQVGALVGHRADEQAAVRAALDRELARAGDALRRSDIRPRR